MPAGSVMSTWRWKSPFAAGREMATGSLGTVTGVMVTAEPPDGVRVK